MSLEAITVGDQTIRYELTQKTPEGLFSTNGKFIGYSLQFFHQNPDISSIVVSSQQEHVWDLALHQYPTVTLRGFAEFEYESLSGQSMARSVELWEGRFDKPIFAKEYFKMLGWLEGQDFNPLTDYLGVVVIENHSVPEGISYLAINHQTGEIVAHEITNRDTIDKMADDIKRRADTELPIQLPPLMAKYLEGK